ncbi:MAG TPA: GTP cyclohydrolase I [Polyangiaceae bacterium]|nr:GTP cyclohydrolase I [Polyangiaceae bacterium]
MVAAYAEELLSGYDVDFDQLIADGSSEASPASGIVALRGVRIATVCPHHLLPALGSATVAYAPGTLVLGLGTLARLVDAFARRLTLQEQIGENVVRALMERAGAVGAYCEIELVHGCLSARGPCQTQARALTVARAGTLASPEATAPLARAVDDAESP